MTLYGYFFALQQYIFVSRTNLLWCLRHLRFHRRERLVDLTHIPTLAKKKHVPCLLFFSSVIFFERKWPHRDSSSELACGDDDSQPVELICPMMSHVCREGQPVFTERAAMRNAARCGLLSVSAVDQICDTPHITLSFYTSV